MNKTGIERAVIFCLEDRRLVVELALSFIVLAAYFAMSVPSADSDLFRVSGFLLAGFYFIGAFFRPDFENMITLICIKVTGVTSASCLVGIIFAIEDIRGAQIALMTGLLLLPAVIYLFFDYLKSPRKETILLVLRGLIISALSFYFSNNAFLTE